MMRRVLACASLIAIGCASREVTHASQDAETGAEEIGAEDADETGDDAALSDVAPWEALCPDDAHPDVAGTPCDTTKLAPYTWPLDDAGLPLIGAGCDALAIELEGTPAENMDALCAFGTRECTDVTPEDAAPRLQCTVTNRITIDTSAV